MIIVIIIKFEPCSEVCRSGEGMNLGEGGGGREVDWVPLLCFLWKRVLAAPALSPCGASFFVSFLF